MGASKDGTMSVRDKINQVLRAYPEDDPPDQRQRECDRDHNNVNCLVPMMPSATTTTTPNHYDRLIPGTTSTSTPVSCGGSYNSISLRLSPSTSTSTSTSSSLPLPSLSFITPHVTVKRELTLSTSNSNLGDDTQSQSSECASSDNFLRDHEYSSRTDDDDDGDTVMDNGSEVDEVNVSRSEGDDENEIGGERDVKPRLSQSSEEVSLSEKNEIEEVDHFEAFRLRLHGELLKGQLDIIKSLSDKLKISDAKREALEKEKKQIQISFESEKQERLTLLDKFVYSEEQRAQFEARIQGQAETIKGQHETIKSHQATIIANQQVISKQKEAIQELESKLAALTSSKAVVSRGTCMTPPPPPPSTNQIHHSPPDSDSSSMPVSTNSIGDEEGMDGPLRKRMRKEGPSSSILTTGVPGSRRSDSPPHLSPAVTPKSSFNSISCLPSSSKALRAFFGTEADEDMGPPDEFHDELELINNCTRVDSGGKMYGHKSIPKEDSKTNSTAESSSSSQFQSYPTSTSTSTTTASSLSFSAFSRPYSARPRFDHHPVETQPQVRQRFILNSIRSRFAHPVPIISSSSMTNIPAHLLDVTTTTEPKNSSSSSSSSLNRNSLNFSTTTTMSSISSKEPPQLSGLRNNNFLNLSRPVPRRPPVGAVPTTTSPGGDQRSLIELTTTTTSTTSSPLSSSEPIPNEDKEKTPTFLVPTSSTPTLSSPKKRPPGRPPGSLSRYKSRLPATPATPNTSTTGGRSSTSSSTLSNGTPEGPQRFSQRGRLLKPNRARFSPTLDASVHQKEKLMTTKKNYFVTEPFATDALCQDIDTTGDGTTAKGMEDTGQSQKSTSDKDMEGDKPTKEDPENEEPEEVVEVPKWRISILHGFKDGEVHKPIEDDMSDEAYLKRHQKLEVKEKQRKRWDSQRMREESYLERLKRKQEERERQKELRRQQRKRKGKSDANEEESVLPSVEDIKAIYVSEELPVGAFGHSLPIVEKVAFRLAWIPQPEHQIEFLQLQGEKKISPLPSPNIRPAVDDKALLISLDKHECKSGRNHHEVKMASPSSSTSPSPTRSLGNEGRTPSPSKMYRMEEDYDDDDRSDSGSDENNSTTYEDDEESVEHDNDDELSNFDNKRSINSTIPLELLEQEAKVELDYAPSDSSTASSSSPPPYSTVDLFFPDECSNNPFDNYDDEMSDQEPMDTNTTKDSHSHDDNDDEQVCSSSISSPISHSHETTLLPRSPPHHHSLATSLPSVVVSRLEKVNLIRCPLGSPTSCSPSSSTENPNSRASITFFIPKNPLAPKSRARSRSPLSSRKSRVSSSTPSSSSPTTTITPDAEAFCKDRNIRS